MDDGIILPHTTHCLIQNAIYCMYYACVVVIIMVLAKWPMGAMAVLGLFFMTLGKRFLVHFSVVLVPMSVNAIFTMIVESQSAHAAKKAKQAIDAELPARPEHDDWLEWGHAGPISMRGLAVRVLFPLTSILLTYVSNCHAVGADPAEFFMEFIHDAVGAL